MVIPTKVHGLPSDETTEYPAQFQTIMITRVDFHTNKQIQRIVVPRAATNLALKKVQGQGHDMVPIETACHKDHACQISMLYL